MKEEGVTEDRLQLLRQVTGSFRPGVLTALMGVSGAGKTTLMDVLAGRKTGGYIEGDIRISGFPKKQETFARISGYCEQTDIHSPQVTVKESLIYSAFLRLPKEVSKQDKMVKTMTYNTFLNNVCNSFKNAKSTFSLFHFYLSDFRRRGDGIGRARQSPGCSSWASWNYWVVNRTKKEVNNCS